MTCASQCYVIGGPWIDYNPECPVHGTDAREDAARQHSLDLDRDTRIAALETAVTALTERIEELESSERSRAMARQYEGY